GTLTLSYVSDGEFVDETTVPDTYSITFTNNKYWESVNCYYWATDDISLSTWPGEAMVHSTTNDYGEKIYTLDIPSTAEYMIFNDGGSNQTVDITITGSAKYYISGGSDKAYTVDTWE
ncbi:MAG: starch-binding protein, partial [Clostridia bacterium]|nr:starch-binding protein [Clostridia bacterium]